MTSSGDDSHEELKVSSAAEGEKQGDESVDLGDVNTGEEGGDCKFEPEDDREVDESDGLKSGNPLLNGEEALLT